MPPARFGSRKTLDWALLGTLGLGLAMLIGLRGIPAAEMLGPLIVAVTLGLRSSEIRVPSVATRLSHAFVGCLIGAWLNPDVMARTISLWPLILGSVSLTFAVAAVTGLFAARWTGIGRELAIWGFQPGLLAAIVEAAEARGIDSRMIAFIQLLRLMTVILALVTLASLLAGPAIAPVMAPSTGGNESGAGLRDVVLISSIAGIGVLMAQYLPFLPAGTSLVPMLLTMALMFGGFRIAVPGWMVALAFFGLGAGVGLRFTPTLLRFALRAMPGLTLACGLLIVLCASSGLLLAQVAGVSPITGILATVPGSIDSLALIAIGVGADVPFIMTFQTVRLLAVALFGPALASFLSRMAG